MLSRRRRGFFGAALAALATVLPLSGTAAPEPIAIPVIMSMTGQAAFLGKGESASLAVIEETVNRSGGIAGRPVKFVISDDQSNPQVAVQLANTIIAAKTPVILGPGLTATCNAVAALVKEGPVELCLAPGVQPPEGSYMFANGASTFDIGLATARYVKQRGWKKIAFIFTTDASGQGGEAVMNTVFKTPENKDVTIVDVEHYGVADFNVAAQLARIKSSGAQMLYLWATGTPAATVLRRLPDMSLDVPVITSSSNATYAQMDSYKSFLPQELLIVGFPAMVAPEQLPRGQLRAAVKAYGDAFRATGVRPDFSQALIWDPALLIVNVLKRLGPSPTAAQFRDYVANLKGWVGILGIYDFRLVPQRGLDMKSSLLMTRWDPAKSTFVSIGPLGL